MIAQKSNFICKYCSMVLNDPIYLPCGIVICNEHTKNLENSNYFNCESCLKVHYVPQKGFDKNAILAKQIESNVHLTNEEKEHKRQIHDLIEKFSHLLDDFKLQFNEFEYFNHEHFADLERKIEIHRENLKIKIDDISQEMIEIVQWKKKFFIESAKIINIDQLKEFIHKGNSEMLEHFRNINISIASIKVLELEQEARLKDLQSKLSEFENLKIQVKSVEFISSFDISHKHFGHLDTKLDYLIKIYNKNNCKIWDLTTNTCVKTLELKENEKQFNIIDYKIMDAKHLLAICEDGYLRTFDLKTGYCKNSFGLEVSTHNTIHLIPSNQVAVSLKNRIQIYNIENGNLDKCFNFNDQSEKAVSILSMLSNKNILFRFLGCHEIKQLDFNNGEVIQTYVGHTKPVNCVQVLSAYIFISGSRYEIKTWNIKTGECLKTLNGNFDWINDFTLTESNQLICASDDCTIRIIVSNNFENIRILGVTTAPVYSLKLLSKDILASICDNEKVQLWDLNSGECLNTLELDEEDPFTEKFEFCSYFHQ